MKVVAGHVFANKSEYQAKTEAPNRGKPWTIEATEHLVDMFLTGHQLSELAEASGRTPGGVCGLLEKIQLIARREPGFYGPYVYTGKAQKFRKEVEQREEAPIQSSQEETTMSIKNEPLTEMNLIFGQYATTLSDDELIEAIRKVENQITSLESIKTKSSKIAARVETLKAQLEKIVTILDGRQ